MTDAPDYRSVVLDACVLIPIRLTMTLLWLAEARVFEPLWSEEILAEVETNLHVKLGLTQTQAASRVSAMRDGFDGALVCDFDHLIPQMTCHAKDRHVLAAAVRAEAGTIVTTNLRDFPASATAELAVTVEHPDSFLARCLVEQRSAVMSALEGGVGQLRRPSVTVREFLASLTQVVPLFAGQATSCLTDSDEQDSKSPLS